MNLRHLVGILSFATLACAQTGEESVKPLLVMISTQFEDSRQDGAGIIVGHSSDRLYIATANHVVRSGPRQAKSVELFLKWLPGEGKTATVTRHSDTTLDLAVLIVSKASELSVPALPFGMLGDSTQLARETGRVRAMGHPGGRDWFARPVPDVVAGGTADAVRFDAAWIGPGYSGGGLFNDKWQLVGMIRSDQPPEGEAVRIERVIERLKDWGYPVQLGAGTKVTVVPKVEAPVEPVAGQTRVNAADGLTYVWIPRGRFVMGCSSGDSECFNDEKLTHGVEITRGFWMGQTEVTQAAYRKVMGGNPSHFKGDDLPVETVDWNDAKSYCGKVGGRLPTEAEWEYAARGGTTGARYGALDGVAWHRANSGEKTHEVKTKGKNAYGLYDTLGNVWEWTADWYGGYQTGQGVDPKGPSTGEKRVIRGGGWVSFSGFARASLRGVYLPDFRDFSLGFRCVRE